MENSDTSLVKTLSMT